MMKIIQVVSAFFPFRGYGGPTTVASLQLSELKKDINYSVFVVTSNLGEDLIEQDDVNVIRAKSVKIGKGFAGLISFDLYSLLESASKVNAGEEVVFHIHFAREFFPVISALYCIKNNIPFVIQTHGMLNTRSSIKNIFDKLITSKIMRSAKFVLALQQIEYARLREISSDANIKLLPNGIDLSRYKYEWESRDDTGDFRILFLARLHRRKNAELLVRSFNLLLKRGHKIKLTIAGGDGGDKINIENLINELGVGGDCILIGEVNEKMAKDLYASHHVYVLPSYDEPFPMTVLEALAIGIPTMVSEGVQISTLLIENQSAIIFKLDENALADSIERAIMDNGKLAEMSNRGRILVEDVLDIRNISTMLKEVYNE